MLHEARWLQSSSGAGGDDGGPVVSSRPDLLVSVGNQTDC